MRKDKERNDVVVNGVVFPNSMWMGLKDACRLKGLNYKTSCNRVELQPNGGKPDGLIGGRKMWRRESVVAWLQKTDKEILAETGQGR